MSCLDYQKVWSCMNDLEDSFNKITTITGLVDFIEDALQYNRLDEAKAGVHALKSFMPVFIAEYDKTFSRAWNNTVIALKQHPHESDYGYEIKKPTYEEVEEFFTNVDEGLGVV